MLDASPDVIDDGDRVLVRYSLDAAPVRKDDVFIASYSPSDVDIRLKAPISYKFIRDLKGSTPFDLVNMRGDYVFVLFAGGLDAPVELCRSNLVAFRNYNAPRAARLMHTHHSEEMQISWSSQLSSFQPRVIYWACDDNPSDALAIAMASSQTWGKEDLCGAPATTTGYRDPGYVHTSTLSQLIPGRAYCYRFGGDDEWSDINRFMQPSRTYPFSVIAYGDEGQTTTDGTTIEQDMPYSRATADLTLSLLEGDPSTQLVIHFGDISYARGYAADWDIFTHMNKDVLSRAPYAVSVGNHEADYPNSSSYQNGSESGGECGVPVQMQFPAPQPGFNKPWYWFASGPLFIFMMSTEHDFRMGSEQYEYIRDTLTNKVDRSLTPWVIFTGHRPMYIDSTNNNTGNGDQTVAEELRKHVEPLLLDAGGRAVDLTLWGHHHSYQRMCSSFAGEYSVTPTSSDLITVGYVNTVGACIQRADLFDGEAVYHSPSHPIPLVVGTAGPSPSTNVQLPTPDFVEKVSFTHGVAHIKVLDESSLHWRFVRDSFNDTIDSFWLLH